MLAGTAYWWMGRFLAVPHLRSLATAIAWFRLTGTAALAPLHLVLHAVLILLGAGLGFSYASWAGDVTLAGCARSCSASRSRAGSTD